jgi:hypothetical protein
MDWIADLLALYPDDGNWAKRRRQMILHRWPDGAVRAAEQDARLGKPDDLDRYDAEVAAIKAAVPKQ